MQALNRIVLRNELKYKLIALGCMAVEKSLAGGVWGGKASPRIILPLVRARHPEGTRPRSNERREDGEGLRPWRSRLCNRHGLTRASFDSIRRGCDNTCALKR